MTIPINPLPTPPALADSPADFNTKAFALLGALPAFVTEANAQASGVDAAVLAAETEADAAALKAGEALISANNAAISKTGADSASDAASLSAASALDSKNAAQSARAVAEAAAAAAHGGIKAYATHAEAAIAAALLPDGADVEVSQDETRVGARTRYKVQAGALVFVVNLDKIRIDLAAPSGAGLIGYSAAAGAVPTTAQEKLRELVSVKDFGCVGDGVTDDTAAMQAAINASVGKTLIVPPGTYLLNAATPIAVQSDANHPSPVHCCIEIPTGGGINLVGTPGFSIFKAKNGIVAPNVLNYWNMFMSNTHDTNVRFDGVVFDLNGQNNPISVAPNAVHQAAVFYSGASAYVDNMAFRDCVFKNSAGLTVISSGFSIAAPAPVGKGLLVENCQFIDNGFGSNDHSSIFCKSKQSIITGNTFTIPTAALKTQNAIEIHAPDSVVSNNTVRDYAGALDVVGGTSGVDASNVSVYGNHFTTRYIGILITRLGSGANSTLSNVNIHDNVLHLVDTPYILQTLNAINPGINTTPSAIMLDSMHQVSGITIQDNLIYKTATYENMNGILLQTATATDISDNIVIKGNRIEKFTRGIVLPSDTGVGGFSKITIIDNLVDKAAESVTPSAIPGQGIVISVPAGRLIVELNLQNNRVIDSQYGGIYLSGVINELNYFNNKVTAGSSYSYTNIATISLKSGLFESGTFTPVFTGLTVVGSPTITGKYSRSGNLCTIFVTIENESGSTTASSNAFFKGMPYSPLTYAVCTAYVTGGSGNSFLNATNGNCYLPNWTVTGSLVVIESTYLIS